ncbi:MAG: hypothetical protein ABW007_00795 [Chitinophagaceae bacterium]
MKKYILGIMAIASVVVFSAFTQGDNSPSKASGKSTLTPILFVYSGDPGDENDVTNYHPKGSETPGCSGTVSELCEIRALVANPDDPQAEWQPILTGAQKYFRN